LGGGGGEYRRWLRETVGALALRELDVLEALRNLRVPLATTNYDDLLEKVTALGPVTWRDQAKAFRVIRGEEQAILHLHGYWDDPESVVLGIRSYEQVRQDAHAQAVVRALAMTQSLLFVGCGEGLSDPNFRPFFTWLREVNPGNEDRHYRLALNDKVVEFQKQHTAEERVFVLGYGTSHPALAGFLGGLGPGKNPRPRATDAKAGHGRWQANRASRARPRSSNTSAGWKRPPRSSSSSAWAKASRSNCRSKQAYIPLNVFR
jgi:hypothetical protein